LGTNMRRAAKAVEAVLGTYPEGDIPATLRLLAHTLRRELGGSSGPLYGVLFLRCAGVLEAAGAITFTEWIEALDEGCRAISELGGANPGDRTMLDALDPYVKALKKNNELETAVSLRTMLGNGLKAAERGVDATAKMKPRMGRSSYLGDRVIGYPDPGAKAVAIWIRAMSEALVRDVE
jgi:dihydroxyacetone kinase